MPQWFFIFLSLTFSNRNSIPKSYTFKNKDIKLRFTHISKSPHHSIWLNIDSLTLTVILNQPSCKLILALRIPLVVKLINIFCDELTVLVVYFIIVSIFYIRFTCAVVM